MIAEKYERSTWEVIRVDSNKNRNEKPVKEEKKVKTKQ